MMQGLECDINTKNMCTVQPKFSHKKTMIMHKAIQKYNHVHQYCQLMLFRQEMCI
jgi:hypothetical protein